MTTSQLENNKQVAQRFLDFAFGMKMQEAIALLSENVSWWVIGDPERNRVSGLKNREQTIRMMSNMHKALPQGMRYQILGITAEADRVALEVNAEGSWYDGLSYRNTYHFLLRIEGEKVAAIREYMDTMQLRSN